MPAMSKFAVAVATTAMAIASTPTNAQNWQVLSSTRTNIGTDEAVFAIDASEIRNFFATGLAPGSAARGQSSGMVRLPLPTGELGHFHIKFTPSSVMAPDLAESFPGIQTYEGYAMTEDKDITVVSAVYTETNGFFAQYTKSDGGVAYLDMVDRGMSAFPGSGSVELRAYDHRVGAHTPDHELGMCLLENDPKPIPSAAETRDIFQQSEAARRLQDGEEPGCNPGYEPFIGNFRCEALLNTPECNYDGGDCCGGYFAKEACFEDEVETCECIDPNAETDTLRKYRIAVGTTIEYSTFHGNTTESVLSALVTTIQRVNGLYKRDLGITLELIANTTKLFDLPGDERRFINEANVINTATELIDSIVGTEAYDVGHVVSTGSGGVASLGSVCAPERKAAGTTGLPNPIGDPFDIDYVAHEVGHQYHGDHTFAGCRSNAGSDGFRYEPGSGTTIMAYAGICGPDNIATNSDPMFHSASIEEIKRFIANPFAGGACGEVLLEGIARPVVHPDLAFPPSENRTEALRECVVPQETPFRLEAMNAPVDETSFHYIWEQAIDSAGISNINGPQEGDTALFRTFTPERFDASRTFPQLADVVSGQMDLAERLPTVDRFIGFALIVRSYFNGPPQPEEDATFETGVGTTFVGDFVYVNVNSSQGEPLRVAQPASTLAFGEPLEVSWTGGLRGGKARILLSLDGGLTFPFLLSPEVDLDAGTVAVEVPTGKGLVCNPDGFTQARVMVQSIDEATPGCSYLNVNPSDIVVDGCGTFPTAAPTPPTPAPTFVTQAPTAGPPAPQRFELSGEGYFSDEGVFANETEALAYDPLPPYSADVQNTYVFTAPEGSRIVVEFFYFNTEADYDYVFVYQGGEDVVDFDAQYAGPLVPDNETSPLIVQSESNLLTLRFISDVAVEEPGFVARYYTTTENVRDSVRRRMDKVAGASVNVAGTLTGFDYIKLDSFYTDKVPASFFGQWRYGTTSGVLRLTFEKFAVGKGSGIIRVFDGMTTADPLIRVVTGNEVPTPVQSSGRAMLVTYETKSEVDASARGFAARVTTVGASTWYWFVGIGFAVIGCGGILVGGKWHFDRRREQQRAAQELAAGHAEDGFEDSTEPNSDDAKMVAGNPLFGLKV